MYLVKNHHVPIIPQADFILRESVCEEHDPSLNWSVAAAQQRIDELAHNINELIKLATMPETAKSAMSDITRFSEEMKTLREFIEGEKVMQKASQRNSTELDEILKRLENEEFSLTEYDDIVARQLIEKITVENKCFITVTFKDGFEIKRDGK